MHRDTIAEALLLRLVGGCVHGSGRLFPEEAGTVQGCDGAGLPCRDLQMHVHMHEGSCT